ncbi:MAG: hypothetical protein KGZ38_05020 [Erysipelothrix sp.]|nr:hypothetical protein [Erysipelothrix sp.]
MLQLIQLTKMLTYRKEINTLGKYQLPIEKKPVLLTPKWLIDNGILCKNAAYKIMAVMKTDYDKERTSMYATKMAIPWGYAEDWLSKKYGLILGFN